MKLSCLRLNRALLWFCRRRSLRHSFVSKSTAPSKTRLEARPPCEDREFVFIGPAARTAGGRGWRNRNVSRRTMTACWRVHLRSTGWPGTPISLGCATRHHKDEASYIPRAKYSLLHNAAFEACDAMDGVKHRVPEDPTRCKFGTNVLLCRDTDGPACPTAPLVEAARKIYSPAVSPREKREIYPATEGYSGAVPLSL
jgi:hypothetical protein